MTLPQMLGLFAAGAAATVAIIGPPISKLVQVINRGCAPVEAIRAIYTTRVDRLTGPEP